MATPIINSQVDQINSALNTLGGDLATLRPLIKNACTGQKRTAHGKVAYISNPTTTDAAISVTGSAFVVDQDYNISTRTSYTNVTGWRFVSQENGCQVWSGTTTASSTINRFYSNGAFTSNTSNKGVMITATGTKVTLSVGAVIRSLPSGKSLYIYFVNSEGTNLASVNFSSTGVDVKSLTYTTTVGTDLYGKIQVSSPGTGVDIDADIYVTVSNGETPNITKITGTEFTLYPNSLVVSDDANMEVNFWREPSSKYVDDVISVCAYNVGHFANGSSSTAAGTDTMYAEFIQTFQEASCDAYLFSEWDSYWNESSGTLSSDVFGSLRPHWGGRTAAITANDYLHQRIASKYPLCYGYLKFFSATQQRHFQDCVVEMQNGENLHLICVHFSTNSADIRATQIQIGLDYISNNGFRYVIVGGDMNLGVNDTMPSTETALLDVADTELAPFRTAGMVIAQTGLYGDKANRLYFNTSNSTSTALYLKPYDNIILTPTMSFMRVATASHNESDHKAVYANILIQPE